MNISGFSNSCFVYDGRLTFRNPVEAPVFLD